MKYFALVALLAAFASAKPHVASPMDFHVYNFTTLLDHFNPQNYVEVNFTFTEKKDYFRPNGPIYIYIQDNGFLTTEFLNTGVMHDLAVETGAVLITASNRFFRENIPTPNASVANLQYLTVDQILADIPYLINGVRHHLEGSENSKVILFGSGLGATLAGWARQVYPHLIDGVWSSSGVYQREVHSAVPFEDLSAAITRIGGADCANDVREAFESIAVLIYNGRVSRLKDDFQSCHTVDYWNEYDVASFYYAISQVFIDNLNRGKDDFESLCAAFATKNTNSDTPELDAFSGWFRSIYPSELCFNSKISYRAFEAGVADWEFIQFVNWEYEDNFAFPYPSRPSLWLACTQLGGWATTVNSQSLFQHDIGQDTFFEFCQASFYEYDYAHLADAVTSLNRRFGGNNPLISNAIFTNAGLDPWSSFGVREQLRAANTYVFNFENYGKSADLFSIHERNSPQLIAAKERIALIITEWGVIDTQE